MDGEHVKNLVKRVRAGDARAFRDLLDAHYPIIFRMAFRFCGHRSDAEDVTQMTCMKLAQNIGTYDGRAAFTTWLYQVVLNTARDWQRSQNRHMRGAVEIGGVEHTLPSSDNTQISLENKQSLDAVRALPEAEREAI